MKVGNFSGDAQAAFKMGKENFFKAMKGKYNGDLNTLWESIEKEAGSVESPKKAKKQ